MAEEVLYCMDFECLRRWWKNFNGFWVSDNPDLLATATHILCPKCHSPTNTNVEVKNTKRTHILAALMCIFWYKTIIYVSEYKAQCLFDFVAAVSVPGFHTLSMVRLRLYAVTKMISLHLLSDFRAVRHYCQKVAYSLSFLLASLTLWNIFLSAIDMLETTKETTDSADRFNHKYVPKFMSSVKCSNTNRHVILDSFHQISEIL